MLRARLTLGLLPLLLLLIAVAGGAILVCRELARTARRDLGANYRLLLGCYEMRDAANGMSATLAQVQTGDPLAARAAFERARDRFNRTLLDQSQASAGTPRSALVGNLAAASDRFTAQAENFLAHGSLTPLASYAQNESALFAVLRSVEALVRHDQTAAQAAAARIARLARLTIGLLAAGTGAAVLLAFYLAWRLARSLLRPIQALTVAAVALGEGDLAREAPVLARDELGALARAFNTMAARLRAYRDAMAEKAQRAQRTMEATLTSAPDPVFIVSAAHAVELKNPAAAALGLDAVPPALARPLDAVLATGRHYLPAGYDQAVTLRAGRGERHFLPRILAIGDPLTGFGGAAVILQDVTKFRLLDDAKSNLVGTVSHELKTPLTSLRLAVYLLLEQNVGALTPEQRELLETARDEADRLLRILNDLLDLSRLESGAAALDRRPAAPADLLAAAAAEIRPRLAPAGLRLAVECAAGLPAVPVDRDRLRHVFANLLTNAVKYSPAGAAVALYARADDDSACVRFGVRDAGPGLDAASLAHVFERFYRAPGQAQAGAGLGLSIAREIVVAHGGSIACASTPGQGSDFYFLLPIAAPSAG